jgi:hypothetical protein
MRLETERPGTRDISTPAEIEAALAALDPATDSFAILSADKERYLQTAMDLEGFIVERCEDHAAPMKALRTALHPTLEQDRFNREEVAAIFTAYLAGADMPPSMHWAPMPMARPISPARAGAARIVMLGTGALLILVALAIPLLLWR